MMLYIDVTRTHALLKNQTRLYLPLRPDVIQSELWKHTQYITDDDDDVLTIFH